MPLGENFARSDLWLPLCGGGCLLGDPDFSRDLTALLWGLSYTFLVDRTSMQVWGTSRSGGFTLLGNGRSKLWTPFSYLPPCSLGGGALHSFVRWQPLPLSGLPPSLGVTQPLPPHWGRPGLGPGFKGPWGGPKGFFPFLPDAGRVCSPDPGPGLVARPPPPSVPSFLMPCWQSGGTCLSLFSFPWGGEPFLPSPLALLVGGGGKGAPFSPPSLPPLPALSLALWGNGTCGAGKPFGVSLGEDGLQSPYAPTIFRAPSPVA